MLAVMSYGRRFPLLFSPTRSLAIGDNRRVHDRKLTCDLSVGVACLHHRIEPANPCFREAAIGLLYGKLILAAGVRFNLDGLKLLPEQLQIRQHIPNSAADRHTAFYLKFFENASPAFEYKRAFVLSPRRRSRHRACRAINRRSAVLRGLSASSRV